MFEREIAASVFKKIYGTTMDVTSDHDKIRMQKAIYLMNELGVPCGDYPFIWYLHGPYSYALDVVVRSISAAEIADCSSLDFDERTSHAINHIKELLKPSSNGSYDTGYFWPEALGSLHYLMTYTMPRASKDQIINRLMASKPHLDNKELNEEAYERLIRLTTKEEGCNGTSERGWI